MKGFVLLVLLLSSSVCAQPVLTSEMMTPSVSDRVIYSHVTSATTYFFGGINRIWDFSSLSFLQEKDTLLYMDPSETPYRNYFLNSSFAVKDKKQQHFYQITSEGLCKIGSVAEGNYTEFFTDAELVYPALVSYGFSVKDSFYSSHNSNGISYEKHGIREISNIGYGTLITDNDVIDSVMLIQVSRSAVSYPGGIETSSEYIWVRKNDPYPILHSRVYKSGNSSESILKVRSSVVNVTSIATPGYNAINSRVHYDSAAFSLTIFDEDIRQGHFDFYNTHGEKLLSAEVKLNTKGRGEIVLPKLPSGFYFTINPNGMKRYKFVVP